MAVVVVATPSEADVVAAAAAAADDAAVRHTAAFPIIGGDDVTGDAIAADDADGGIVGEARAETKEGKRNIERLFAKSIAALIIMTIRVDERTMM